MNTPLSVLKERYRSMVKRCYLERHSSTPEGLCSKEEFLEFGMSNPEYHRLYNIWKELGFPRGQSPSVDRIEVTKGYSLDNIQFLPFVENIAKSHVELIRQKKSVVLQKGDERLSFVSGAEAGRWLGVTKQSVQSAMKTGGTVLGWRAISKDTPEIKKRYYKRQIILEDGVETKTFSSLDEAAQFLGLTKSGLRAGLQKGCLLQKQWRGTYKEE